MIHFRIKIRTTPASPARTGSMGTPEKPHIRDGKSLFYYILMVRACACEAFQKLSFTFTEWRETPVYRALFGLSAPFGTFTYPSHCLTLVRKCLNLVPTPLPFGWCEGSVKFLGRVFGTSTPPEPFIQREVTISCEGEGNF